MEAGALRRRRLLLGFATSGLAKVMAVGVQLFALPLALHALGTERYAGFLALQSFLSWVGIFGFGLLYSLPKYIAAAHVEQDEAAERSLVRAALLLMLLSCLALLLLMSAVGLMVPPGRLVAAGPSGPREELVVAYFTAVAVNALQLFSSIQQPLRSGYQENHHSNVCAAAASILMALGLLYLSSHQDTITAFILVLYMPITLAFLGDIGLLFLQRPYLALGHANMKAAFRKIAAPSGNAIAYQIQFALVLYLPTLVVAHLSTPDQTAAFGSVLQLVVLGISGLNLILHPLNAAMANAHSHGDYAWMERNHMRVFSLVLTVGVAAILLGGTIGPFVVRQWMGPSIHVSGPLVASAATYFLGMAVIQLEFFLLSAMGALAGSGRGSMLLGLLALLIGSLLCLRWGATGMAIGVASGMPLLAGWLFLRARRQLRAG